MLLHRLGQQVGRRLGLLDVGGGGGAVDQVLLHPDGRQHPLQVALQPAGGQHDGEARVVAAAYELVGPGKGDDLVLQLGVALRVPLDDLALGVRVGVGGQAIDQAGAGDPDRLASAILTVVYAKDDGRPVASA